MGYRRYCRKMKVKKFVKTQYNKKTKEVRKENAKWFIKNAKIEKLIWSHRDFTSYFFLKLLPFAYKRWKKWLIKMPQPWSNRQKWKLFLAHRNFTRYVFLKLTSINTLIFEKIILENIKWDFKICLIPFCAGEILSKHAGWSKVLLWCLE